jgi:hypothetical protein
MIQVIGPPLNQWDVGRSISVSGSNATHVHMANRGDSYAAIMEIVNGEAQIPNYLLQSGKDLCIYLVLDKVTQESKTFPVRKRERPQDYVYSKDKRNYIYELITEAEEATKAANQVARELLDAKDRGDFNGPKGEPGGVCSVNGVKPDENGNVEIDAGSAIIGSGAPPFDPDNTEVETGRFYYDQTRGHLWLCTQKGVEDSGNGAPPIDTIEWANLDWRNVKSVNGISPDENGNVEIEVGGGTPESAVLYTEQVLNPEQQEQARANINTVDQDEITEVVEIADGDDETVVLFDSTGAGQYEPGVISASGAI